MTDTINVGARYVGMIDYVSKTVSPHFYGDQHVYFNDRGQIIGTIWADATLSVSTLPTI